MISFKHLSIKEIEQRIEHINNRVAAFEDLIKDISNPDAKIPLETQLKNYKETLYFLCEELAKRIKLANKNKEPHLDY